MSTPETVKFLLVDDLEENLLALQAILQGPERELLEAHSGPEALEYLLANDVALAIIDVQMPGMDGFELAELMRGTERTRRVPIIFLTAGAIDERRRFRGYETGAVDFLFKPIEPEILQSKVQVFFELYRQRQELTRHRDALQVSERAAASANMAKDQFLAVLSHELRTPLSPVRLTVSSWERDKNLPTMLIQDLTMIRRNVDLVCRLIDDMLDLNRVAQGKIDLQQKHVDMHDEIRHTIRTVLTDATARRITISFEPEAKTSQVIGDPARIQQILWNLLRNAIKFTSTGGSVLIRTAANDGQRFLVTVQDTGIGIEPFAIHKIFNAFEQADKSVTRQFGGLGLGLTISKRLAELHHGTLTAQSNGKNQGAAFTLSLPLATAASEKEEEPARISTMPVSITVKQNHKRIMVLEDHEDTAKVIKRLLQALGYDILMAHSVAEAKTVAENNSFDYLISDIGLPDGTGLDFMRWISGQRQVRAVALTGFGMEDDVRRSLEVGFMAHLTKPINIELLEQTLNQLQSTGAEA